MSDPVAGVNHRVEYSRGRSVTCWPVAESTALWSYLTDPARFPHVDLTPAPATEAEK